MRTKTEALAHKERRQSTAASNAPPVRSAVKSQLADIPAPPFWGARTLRESSIDLRELWSCFDLRSLFRLSWGGANTKGAAFERLVAEEFEPRLQRYQAEALRGGLLYPRVVYGYFPATGLGDDVILYDPNDPLREIARMTFPRQAGGEHLSLADYLREPGPNGERDVVALQIVTARERGRTSASTSCKPPAITANRISCTVSRCKRLKRSRSGRTAGFGASLASNPIAENVTRGATAPAPISSSMRSSSVCSMRPRSIGVTLTEGFQIVPEQSTAAIVMHHPKASYFNAAAQRELAAT